MIVSIWRYAHLALAILSTAFLLVLSTTGVILAYDAVEEKTPAYRVENFQELNLAQVLSTLRENYFEVIEIKVDHNDFVTLDAVDEEGNPVKAYIDPNSGKKLGEIKPKSEFIQWITALHRSLFLKETGRIIVGVVSFLLMLISISGVILIIKRQKGIRNFFSTINKDFFSQYYHVVSGRWLLLPILVIAVTGTLIFLTRLEFFKGEEIVTTVKQKTELPAKDLKDIEFFKNTKLRSVERVEFPFIPDDEAEPFVVHLRKKTVTINQVTGAVVSESVHPFSSVVEKFNLDLHTGRTNSIWAIILGIASLNILMFIYSGFVIMFRRTRTKIKNKYKSLDAEVVILVGSENGTTLYFANQIHKQLLNTGKKSFLAQLDDYEDYPSAKHLLIFSSTYGLGDAPTNGKNFEKLLGSIEQSHEISFSVVGFGSKSYEEFCAFAHRIDEILSTKNWAKRATELYKVNDRSAEDFVKWAHDWSEKTGIALATAPAVYSAKIPGLKSFEVVEKSAVSEDNSTFIIKLKTNQKFQSGDLLAIYPAKDSKERFYSVGKVGKEIQLIVKLYPGGFGSEYLYNLKIGEKIEARIMENSTFHLPQDVSKIAMIANGTGIAPFLGMIEENKSKKDLTLYAGFRHRNSLTENYRLFADELKEKGQLTELHFAFSREEDKMYVMDLIKRDEIYFANLFSEGGVVMICGALKMQKDVEIVLDELLQRLNSKPLEYYIKNKQVLTDCY